MPAAQVSVVNVGYRSTNYWVISAGRSRVLVDLGWPGTMGAMRASLARADIPLAEIRYALATHYHIDHAGLAQDLKNAGVPLLLIDLQVPFVPLMTRHIKPQDHFTEISMHGNVVMSIPESRSLLKSRSNPPHCGTGRLGGSLAKVGDAHPCRGATIRAHEMDSACRARVSDCRRSSGRARSDPYCEAGRRWAVLSAAGADRSSLTR